MPLDKNALGDALAAVFASMPASKEDCAVALATAYQEYAQEGLFAGCVPTLINELRDVMAEAIALALTPPGAPPTIGAGWANAVNVFWAAVPVVGLSDSGVTAGCPGAGSLVGALSAVFANPANTATSCGHGCADALHTATLTVEAELLIAGPTPIE